MVGTLDPVADQRGLAEAGGRGDERQPPAGLEGGVQPLGEPIARHEPRAPGRHEELGGQDRRGHGPIIGLAA